MSNKSPWVHILTAEELDEHYSFIASIDPSYARSMRQWYDDCTPEHLDAEAQGAWLANDSNRYQLCRSHAALKRNTVGKE